MLTVLQKTGKTKYKKPSIVWLCKCDCGTIKEVSAAELACCKSCGCLRTKSMATFGERNKGRSPPCTLPPGESTLRTLYACYKKSAKKRSYLWDIEPKDFRRLIAEPCHYCGSPPSQVCKDRHRIEGNITYNGIDRVDNTKGYTTENSVPCCYICNRAKDTMTKETFANWIRRVYHKVCFE